MPAIRADLEAVKAAGANLARVHFPQTPATLRIADEVGLLFIEEAPLNWWRAAWHPPVPPEYRNDRIIDSAELALERMIRRDINHPSVIAWSMANECRTDDSLGVHAMERLLRRARALDPSRLVTYVANRAFAKNRAFALADFVAINLYFGMWGGDVAESLGDMDSLVHRPTREGLAEIALEQRSRPLASESSEPPRSHARGAPATCRPRVIRTTRSGRRMLRGARPVPRVPLGYQAATAGAQCCVAAHAANGVGRMPNSAEVFAMSAS